ncbi:Dabb family protein [Curvibacter lanceolatus]|uniref:Dabb family protein n=1 Tax=Curvibacter lanceolatus TaxID=86182 RepID=UPI00146C339D
MSVPIVHVVTWRLNGDRPEVRATQAAKIVAAFRALEHDVPGMVRMEIGANVTEADDAWDLALVSVFRTRTDLMAYQSHPAHLALKHLVAPLRSQRAQVDFELPE